MRGWTGIETASLAIPLEPRFMFDAAGVATAADAASAPDHQVPAEAVDPAVDHSLIDALAQAAPAAVEAGASAGRQEIAFVDSNVQNAGTLIQGLSPDVEVVLLSPGEDGIRQMADALAGRTGIDAIHVFSHGVPGGLALSSVTLTAANMDAYAGELAAIGRALTAEGDILVYGCDIGAGSAGSAFIDQLSALTGADVAASTDGTGAASAGGDWDLEARTGVIEAAFPLTAIGVESYQGLMSTDFTVETGASNPLDAFGAIYPGTPNGNFVVGDFIKGAYEGYPDIAVRMADNTGIEMWRNNGNGTFTRLTGGANPFAAINLGGTAANFLTLNALVGDWDSDGDIDIFNKATNQFYRNDGASFSVQTGASNPLDAFGATYPATPNGNFVVGDFNKDGYTDVVVRMADNTGIEMWRNNGNGTFTRLTGGANPFAAINLGGTAANFLTLNALVGDWDSDGDIDIFNKATNQFYRNDGASFSVQTGASNPLDAFGATYPATPNGNFAVGDFDGDGFIDVAVRNANNINVDMWRNNGNGTFTELTGGASPFAAINLGGVAANFLTLNALVGDWDGDGDDDIFNKATNQFFEQGDAPTTITASPNGSTSFPVDGNIQITFSETIASGGEGTIEIRRASDGLLIETIAGNSGRVTGFGTNTITIDPAAVLAGNTTYYIIINKRAVFGSSGQTFMGEQDPTAIRFTTEIPNPAPVVDANGPAGGTTNTTTFTEDGPAVRIVTSDAALTDDDNITGMTLVLGAAPNGTAEAIAYNAALNGGASLASLGLTGSYDSATRTFTLSGTASAAVYQGVLRAMEYNNTSDAPNTTARTVTITATDAEGATGQTTATINITAVNDAPTATNLSQSKSATEGGAAVALDDIVVTDLDGADTITATLTLSNPAAGSLSTGTYGSATSTYNAVTGVWTVTGSVADVNAALAAVALTPSADNDQDFTIATRIRDQADAGPADGTITVTVTAVNDAPVATVPASISVTEDTATALTGISFSDVDAGSNPVVVTLSVPAGALTATSGSGVTVGGTASALTLTGTIADINAFIAGNGVTYTPAANDNGTRVLTVEINDGGNTGGPAETDIKTVNLDISAVNDAPSATVPASISVTEDTAAAITGISFSDVDAGSGNVVVTLSVPAGSLAATTGSGVTVGGTASALTLTGTIADINAFIAASNVTYTPAANDNGTRVLTVGIDDGGNTGSGGSQTDTKTINLDISAVNDAPSATNLTQTVPYNENPGGSVALGDIVVTDVDTDDEITATLTLSNPAAGALSTGTFGSATSTYDAATGVWTVTGSVADVNAALSAVAFTPVANWDQDVTIATRIRDAADTGPADGTITLDVTPAPSVTGVTAPLDDAYKAGDVLEFSIDFDAAVTVTGGIPQLAITLDTGGTVLADYVAAASTSTRLVFRYTVLAGQNDANGIALGTAILANGATIRGATDGDADLDLSGIPDMTGILVDTAAPVADPANSTPADDSAGAGPDSNIVLRFDGPVLLGSGGSIVLYNVTDGSVLETIPYNSASVTGWGTNAITIDPSSSLPVGKTVAVRWEGTVFQDAAGNFAAENATDGFYNFTVRATPVLAGPSTDTPWAEGDDPVQVAPGLTVTDADSDAIEGATVTITNFVAGDMLAVDVPGPFTASYDPATGVLTLTGTGTLAEMQAALRSVTFASTSQNPTDAGANLSRSIVFQVDELGGGNGLSNTVTSTVAVTGENDAPSATNLTQSKAVTEGGAAIDLDDIVVTDPDGVDTITATLTLSSTGAGALSTGTYGSATSTYNAATGVWTVTGSIADVNAALAAVQFTPSADNDQNFTIAIRIRDAADAGPADGTITIAVTPVNDAPVVTAPSSISVTEDTQTPLTGISFSDVDAGSGNVVVTLTVSAGVLEIAGTPGLTVGGNNTATLTLTGSIADINTFIAGGGVIYKPAANDAGTRTLTVLINDNGSTGTGGSQTDTETVDLNISAVNDAPVATVPSSISVTEDTPTSLTGISFNDVDAGSAPVVVTLSVPAGALTATSGSGVTVGGTASALTLTGTIADINAFIAASNVTYTPAANDNGTRVLTVGIDDGGNTGSGGSQTDTKTINLDISAVNDTPSATNLTQTKAVTEGDGTVALDDIVVTDVDAGETITATLTLGNPGAGSLTTGTYGSATSTYDAGTGVWTVTGSVTDVNAALAAVSLTLNAENDRNVTITTRIRDAAGAGPADGTITVTVTPVPDAPTATNLTQTKAVIEGGLAIDLDDIIVTDPDTGDTITVTLTLSNAGAGTLSTGTYGSATSTYNAGTGVWTVTGSVTEVNAALAAVTLTPSADNDQDFTIAIRIRDAADAGPADGTITVAVTPVNDAPVVTAPSSISVTEDTQTPLTGISFSDVDAGSGNVVVTLTVSAGVLEIAGTPGLTVGGNNTATLTLTGSIADINTFIAGGGVIYKPAANDAGTRTLTVSINDNGSTGTGGSQTDTKTVTLDISGVNDAPVATLPSGQAKFVVGDWEIQVTNGAGTTLADVDSTHFSGLTVVLSGIEDGASEGIDVTDITRTLLAANGLSLSAYDPATGTRTITGTATREVYEQVLRGITYYNQEAAPDKATRTLSVTVTDAEGAVSAAVTRNVWLTERPVVEVNVPQTVTKNDVLTLTAGMLRTVDAETTDPAKLTYVLIGQPDRGTLRLNGAILRDGGTFTQADIDAGRVTFEGTSRGTGGFTFQVRDEHFDSAKENGRFVVEVEAVPGTQQAARETSAPAEKPVEQFEMTTLKHVVNDPVHQAISGGDISGISVGARLESAPLYTQPTAIGGRPMMEIPAGGNGDVPAGDDHGTSQRPGADAGGGQPVPGPASFSPLFRTGGPEGLVRARDIAPASFGGEAGTSFKLPDGLFSHSRPDAGVWVEARLADGSPLPAWLHFDAATGTFTGKPPAGFSGTMTIEVVAHDRAGASASATLHLNVKATGEREQAPDQRRADVQGEQGEGAEPAEAGGTLHARSEVPAEEVPAGKPSLSAQLRAAGHGGLLADAAALLESVAGIGRAA